MLFKKNLKESNHKPNKIWVDKGRKFYNRSMKSWLEKNDTEMCSTHNEGISAVAERFIRTLKNKIYEYITSISKNAYVDKLDNIDLININIDPNWSEDVFVIKKVKNILYPGHISDFNGEEIVGTIYKIELQKTNQKEFRVEKVIKRKGDELYVKWKGCDSSFNS